MEKKEGNGLELAEILKLPPEAMLYASEVAKMLRVGINWVYVAAKKGKLPCHHWGDEGKRETIRFRKGDIEAFLEKSKG